jgi:hypothetical protein
VSVRNKHTAAFMVRDLPPRDVQLSTASRIADPFLRYEHRNVAQKSRRRILGKRERHAVLTL